MASEKVGEMHDEKEKKKAQDESSPGFLLRLIAVLTAICVFVAVLLAAVNAVTKDKIAENTLKTKTESILSIFKGGTSCELLRTEPDGSEVYLVLSGENILGYCAFVSTVGFGGNIDMMVGIDSDYRTEGVSIVAMSETPGVGTKAKSSSFLSLFTGKGHDAPAGGVDVISGATISSDAVKAGVEKAHGLEVDLAAIASERGVSVMAPSDAVTVPDETEGPSETGLPTEDTSADTEPGETPSATEKEPDVLYYENRPEGGGYAYPVDGTEGDDRYNMEVSRDDETATFTKETEPEPVTTPESVTTPEPETEPATTEKDTIPEWLVPPDEEETTAERETMPGWLVPDEE